MRYALSLSLLLLLTACSSSSPTTAPVAPLSPDTPLPVGALISDGQATLPLGRFTLEVSETAATLTPARMAQATVGQLFNADVTDAFTGSFCHDCLRVTSVSRLLDGVRVNVEIEHPFALADDLQPPSALNRRDLWISSVKGILLVDGSDPFFNDTVIVNPSRLMSPDGWTSLLLPPGVFNATAFPYNLFVRSLPNLGPGNFDPATGWDTHLDDPSGYGILANGQTATRFFDIRLAEGETIALDYVLTASFMVSAPNRFTRLAPQHFMPAGAAPEPLSVRTQMDAGSALIAGDPGSSVAVQLLVADYQADPALAVDPLFPNPLNRNGLAVDSGIASVSVAMPAITGVESLDIPIAGASGTGTPPDFWTLGFDLFNTTAAPAGRYVGLIKVVDERDPLSIAAPYGTTTFIGPDLATPYTPPAEFATYHVFQVEVEGTIDCLPFNVIYADDSPIYDQREPFYQLAQTQAEFDALLPTLIDPPPPLPPIDWATESVILACASRFFDGRGMRTIDLASVCPNAAFSFDITVDIGEPQTCPTTFVPTAPFFLATAPIKTVEPVAFFETFHDTCQNPGCTPLEWGIVDMGNATTDYDGPPFVTFVDNDTAYAAAAGQLIAGPLPPIDFATVAAVVMTSGASMDRGDRYIQTLDVCRINDPAVGTMVTIEAGEYLSCAPVNGIVTAPYQIVTFPPPIGVEAVSLSEVDVCGPPPVCDNPIPYTVLMQGDLGKLETPSEIRRITTADDFTSTWASYFPEIEEPTVNFGVEEVILIAPPQNIGSGLNRIEIRGVCDSPANGERTVDYAIHAPSDLCAPGDGLPSRPIVILTAPTSPIPMPINFVESTVDSCLGPACVGFDFSIIEEGSAPVEWTGEARALIIENDDLYQKTWAATHPAGETAPPVNFASSRVAFNAMGWLEEGFLFQTTIEGVCDAGIGSSINVTDTIPQSCPPPPPFPSSPFVFVEMPRQAIGDPGWFTVSHFVKDACEPPPCLPTPTEQLAGGNYQPNQNPDWSILPITDQSMYDLSWAMFFTGSTPPPQPAIDFGSTDALLLATGWTPFGYGQRSVRAIDLCVDDIRQEVTVNLIDTFPFECPTTAYAAQPWVLLTLPPGTAEYFITPNLMTEDGCTPPGCYGYQEVAHSLDSDYAPTEMAFHYLDDPDLNNRKTDYLTVWNTLHSGTDPAPGIDEMTDSTAVLVLIHGFVPDQHGLWDIDLLEYCGSRLGFPFKVIQSRPDEGCTGLPVTSSPYRIFFMELTDPAPTGFSVFPNESCVGP